MHNTAVPNALAVDWIGKNLYWSDTEKRIIEVSKLNGLYPTILVSKRLKFPRDLSLDPRAGFVTNIEDIKLQIMTVISFDVLNPVLWLFNIETNIKCKCVEILIEKSKIEM